MDEQLELAVFANERFGAIRGVLIDGQPHVVGRDVAALLGYTDTDQAIRNHCKSGKIANTPSNRRGNPNVVMIPEPDIYRLIFGSKLPEAEEFQNWVFEEVLPSLRKTGAYALTPAPQPSPTLAQTIDVLSHALRLIEQKDLEMKEQQKLLEQAKQPPPPPVEEVKFHPFSLMSPEGIVEACQAAASKSEIAEAFLGYSDLHEFLADAYTSLQLNEVKHVVYNALKTARGLNANPTLLKCRRDVTLWCWAVSIVEAAHDSTRAKKERGSK